MIKFHEHIFVSKIEETRGTQATRIMNLEIIEVNICRNKSVLS